MSDILLELQSIGPARLHPPLFLSLVALAAAFAIHGRAVGAGVKGARSIGSVALIAASYLLAGLPGGLLALGAAISRAMDFGDDVSTPDSASEILQAAGRYYPFGIAVAIAAITFGQLVMIPLALGYMAIHLALAINYGRAVDRAFDAGRAIGKENTVVELGQGAALGLSIWLGAVVMSPYGG